MIKKTLTLSLALASSLLANKTNILFIFSDDHATQAISAYGGRFAKVAPTPNLDRLADEGMLFKRCMVTNSICGPSRATILTGKYSHLNGFMVNEKTTFNGAQQTFPKLLQKAGYETSIIGKWHLGSKPTGFDHWDILPGQGMYYNPDFDSPQGRSRVEGYCTEVVTDKALTWLKKERDSSKPFMLMVQHKAPHREWSPALKYLNAFDDVKMPEPSSLFDDYEGRGKAARNQDMSIDISMELGKDLKVKEFDKKGHLAGRIHKRMTAAQLKAWNAAYEPKNQALLEAKPQGKDLIRWKYQRYVKDYLRCIKSVDDSLGQLLDYLDESGLAQNTIVIYSSDQGFYLGEHGWFDKRFMYDESYRTPLLIRWPGHTKEGSKTSKLVSNLDFAETFLEIAGEEIPSDMQGASLVPLLKGEDPKHWRKSHYYHYYEFPGWHMVQRHEGAYDGRYKLMYFYDIDEWELYDLKADPEEMTNQFNNPEYSSVLTHMKQELQKLRSQHQVPKNKIKDVSNPSQKYITNHEAEVIN
ncbi:mucin-desulfating sulfatase (N-acetylglucosamine-6-sulfatase) [Lentisphaera araneosa HTCC2155]|uniref:Mucin-desulfating sulfatase (N-acetylglucosamine-6-sulfatase) n=1 Tax=Lentisphaera araneosa HTCC2155 TaxID=313628 RepID=A6DGX9_9BACT|nr:sulfatase [Lentisphaera araneosa]EDM28862.1 mucin-desulfating sulfatase (N-acetylglucosamine-6-sulfatase) [Lentisphaera araneosa HTCC2155]